MNIVATAIARPVTVAMATFAVALFGGLSLDRLGLNLLPELAYPTLTVRTDFEGAAPAEVEEQITRRLEERVGVINGLRRMHSISAAERSDVVLEFAWGTDMTNAAVEVREKLDLVRLPLEVERPSILRLNPNLDPIVRSAVVLKEREAGAETAQLQELRRFAEDVVKKRLDPVIGVAAVLVSGGFEDEIAVDVDQERLARLGMSVQSLGQRLQAANINLSGGRLTARGEEFLVRTVNEFESVGDIAETIVFQDQGRVLRLKDVATVTESHKERDSVMRVDGNEAIEIAMYKEGDANTVAVAAAIHERMDEIAADLPANYELVTIYDQAEFISAAIDEVRYAAIIGGLLAVIVLYLFLKDVRSTLIVTATIPVSVLATFVLMDAFDITLNIMSLGGIALAVGMLMDNAIVVLENIARHRNDPLTTLADAARRGTGEMGGAVLASTMTTIAVFLPLAFVEGIAGQLFRDQALTVTFALLASLVLAFTLIPMLSAIAPGSTAATDDATDDATAVPWWRRGLGVPFRLAIRGAVATWRLATRALALSARPAQWAFDQVYDRVFAGYDILLRSALRFRALTLSVAFAALGGAAALVPNLPLELIPPLSQGEFRVDIELEPGTRLELTDALLADAQQTLLTFPGVATTYSVAGTGGRLDASASRGGEQIGELSVVLAPDATPSDEARVMSLTRDRLESVPAAQFTVERPQLFTFATPLEVEVAGNDLQALEMVAERLVAAMSASPSFSDVESSIRPGYPELQIEFDQERTAATGLFVPDVANRVVRKIRGDVPTKFTWRDKRVDIRVRLDRGGAQLEGRRRKPARRCRESADPARRAGRGVDGRGSRGHPAHRPETRRRGQRPRGPRRSGVGRRRSARPARRNPPPAQRDQPDQRPGGGNGSVVHVAAARLAACAHPRLPGDGVALRVPAASVRDHVHRAVGGDRRRARHLPGRNLDLRGGVHRRDPPGRHRGQQRHRARGPGQSIAAGGTRPPDRRGHRRPSTVPTDHDDDHHHRPRTAADGDRARRGVGTAHAHGDHGDRRLAGGHLADPRGHPRRVRSR